MYAKEQQYNTTNSQTKFKEHIIQAKNVWQNFEVELICILHKIFIVGLPLN